MFRMNYIQSEHPQSFSSLALKKRLALPLFGLYIQFIDNMQHPICRDDIVICFCYTLRIYTMTDIGEIAEYVKAVEDKG